MSNNEAINIDALVNRKSFPSERFEQESGMTGLSCTYKMPGGMDMEDAQKHYLNLVWEGKTAEDFRASRHIPDVCGNEQAAEFIREIINLNPELANVHFDLNDNLQTDYFVKGIFHHYLPEDIDFFINDNSMGWDNYRMLLKLKININFTGWAPSGKTIKKIKSQFGLSDWQPAEAEARSAKRRYFKHFYDIDLKPARGTPAPA
jgi:hypothetical protein